MHSECIYKVITQGGIQYLLWITSNIQIMINAKFLFSATVQFSLHPFSEHNDGELWLALERQHVEEVIGRNSFGTGKCLDYLYQALLVHHMGL